MLIEAVASQDATDTVLALAGSGPDEGRLRELAARRGVSERVRFLGLHPRHRPAGPVPAGGRVRDRVRGRAAVPGDDGGDGERAAGGRASTRARSASWCTRARTASSPGPGGRPTWPEASTCSAATASCGRGCRSRGCGSSPTMTGIACSPGGNPFTAHWQHAVRHQKRRTGKGERWPALNSRPCRCSSSSGIPAAGIVAPRPPSSRRWSGCCPAGSRPVICDPLRGPDVPGLLRWFAGLYGLCIRLTPWLWWSFWRTSNSRFGLRRAAPHDHGPGLRQRRAGRRGLPPRADRGVPPDDGGPGRPRTAAHRRRRRRPSPSSPTW